MRATGFAIRDDELTWRFSHAGGPGGQGVNTADSRVELALDLTRTTALTPLQRDRALRRLAGRLADGVLTVVAAEHRSQLRNREAARARLEALLRTAIAPDPAPRRPTRPSRGAQRRRLAARKRHSERKRDRRGDPGREDG